MIFKYEIKTVENNSVKDIFDIKNDFVCATEPSDTEKIKFVVDENTKSISIVANKAGWEYLAKVCVEMSFCAEQDPSFHIHRKADMSVSGDEKQDVVSFYVD